MCVVCSRCRQRFYCRSAKFVYSEKEMYNGVFPEYCPADFIFVSSCKDCWAKEELIG